MTRATPHHSSTPAPTLPRRSRLWPEMVFALIGLNFCVVALTVYAARSAGSSFAVEPEYDRKALHWDDVVRAQAAQRALGWSAAIDVVGPQRVRVSVLDRAGVPVANAVVDLEAFHHAQAKRRIFTRLTEVSSAYEGAVALDAPGLWEFRLTVTRGADTFTTSVTRALTSEPAP